MLEAIDRPHIDFEYSPQINDSLWTVAPKLGLIQQYISFSFDKYPIPAQVKIIFEDTWKKTSQGKLSGGWIHPDDPSIIHVNIKPAARLVNCLLNYATDPINHPFPQISMGKNTGNDQIIFKNTRLKAYLSYLKSIDIDRSKVIALFIGIQAGNRIISTALAHELRHLRDYTSHEGNTFRSRPDAAEMSAMDATRDFLTDYIPYHSMLALVPNLHHLESSPSLISSSQP